MRTAAAAGALASLPHLPLALARRGAPMKAGKKILILGGTIFVGPSVIEAAKKRGHTITVFNRGRAEKKIGPVDGVEHLYGNRDPNLNSDEKDTSSPKGLESLKGRTWDAVVDTSPLNYRRVVKASAELLAASVKQYVYISSISVYKSNEKVNADETDTLNTLEDPDIETMGARFENYGGLKAVCEKTVEEAMPGRTCSIRPGLIVGPGDLSDRFTYWPVRIQQGGEVMAPGTPEDPIQLIDVRDLGEWIVKVIEDGTMGTFDAVGPPAGLTMGKMLDACKQAARSEARFTWVDADFLAQEQVEGWSDMPVWVPPRGESAGFHRRSIARAVGAGLKFRPVVESARDTLAWWPKEVERRRPLMQEAIDTAVKEGKPAPDPSKVKAGIKPEREAEVLAAWHKKQGS